jgi:hypothetical protein
MGGVEGSSVSRAIGRSIELLSDIAAGTLGGKA